jgi:hypothetical protein
LEQERVQERIALVSLSTKNFSETEYLERLLVSNIGTITTRIRAIYIDNIFICDPTNSLLNPFDTYINPKDSLNVQLPDNLLYEPLSKIEVATERGIKSVEYEWILRGGNQTDPPSEIQKIYFGPLLLDFDKFYYTEVDNDGSYNPDFWQPGWSVERGLQVVWNITVTNIDDRNITINNNSTLTLVKNAEGGQCPWYIELPNGQNTLLIPSNTTANLLYIWDGPLSGNPQELYNPPAQKPEECRVFMAFFGFFHENDGSTKPYGQTIPFEAVLIRGTQMVITANPATIAAASTMNSTITLIVTDEIGNPKVNEPVTFTTDLGTLSSSEAITDSSGIATVTLFPGLDTGTAQIIANWSKMLKSTSVDIISGDFSMSADPSTVAAGSTMSSTITATVNLLGNPLPGETVTFTNLMPTLGTLSSTEAITDGLGEAIVTFIPGTLTGTVTITAEWGTVTPEQTSIEIISGTLSVLADPSTVAAGSTMSSTITATVNLLGNPLPGETVTFTNLMPTLGTLSSTEAITDDLGKAIVTFIPGTLTGPVTITAEWGTVTPEQTSITIQ